jgi:4'-phosphopantetheinyl transferase
MPSDAAWAAPPEQLSLSDDEVHVWRAQLAPVSPSQLQNLRSLLAPDEIGRAERFHFEHDRASFIIARATLRAILSAYLQLHPSRLRFGYNAYGKPSLDNDEARSGLRFNLAHSRDVALYAFARKREIGIDVEYMRAGSATDEMIDEVFPSAEIAMLRKLSPQQRAEAFFNCWTLKEAYIKARGEGLSFPLKRFDVSFASGEQRAALTVHGAAAESERWALQTLRPGDAYAAAIAVEGHDWNLRCWQAASIK